MAKIDSVRANLPDLEHVVVIDGDVAGAMTLDELGARGAGGDPGELDRRIAAVADDDGCLIIYTSGTTGRPKGVLLTNRGFAAGRTSTRDMQLFGRGDSVYLYLPLAHVFGQICQAATPGGRRGAGVLGRRSQPDHRRAGPGAPDRAAVGAAHLREGLRPGDGVHPARAAPTPRPPPSSLGVRVRDSAFSGETFTEEEQAAFDRADAEMFSLVRGIFGGHIKLAVSGAAPIAPDILRFFYAAGVPVMEGWGMTETTAIGTLNLPEAHRFGSIGRAVAGADIRIADDGEIEMAGPMLMKEYWRNPAATAEVMTDDGYLRTGDLGLDRRRRLRGDHRAQEGHHHHGRRQEPRRPPTSRATCGGRGGSRRS